MDHFENSLMTPFDRLVSSDRLQMMKLAIPYIPPSGQRMMALYIKFEELKSTFHFFEHFKSDIHSQAFERKISSPSDILNELLPFLPEKERESMEQITNMLSMMDMFTSMQASDNEGGAGMGGMNPMELLKGMMPSGQQEMFDMYSAMFDESLNNAEQKGDDTDERMDESSGA